MCYAELTINELISMPSAITDIFFNDQMSSNVAMINLATKSRYTESSYKEIGTENKVAA